MYLMEVINWGWKSKARLCDVVHGYSLRWCLSRSLHKTTLEILSFKFTLTFQLPVCRELIVFIIVIVSATFNISMTCL